jgi:hypothetical protein
MYPNGTTYSWLYMGLIHGAFGMNTDQAQWLAVVMGAAFHVLTAFFAADLQARAFHQHDLQWLIGDYLPAQTQELLIAHRLPPQAWELLVAWAGTVNNLDWTHANAALDQVPMLGLPALE